VGGGETVEEVLRREGDGPPPILAEPRITSPARAGEEAERVGSRPIDSDMASFAGLMEVEAIQMSGRA
jgi:hypothetical protein